MIFRAETPEQVWPRDIPRKYRQRLDTGFRSFCFQHEFVGEEAFGHPVQVRHAVLIVAVQGAVLIDTGEREHLLEEGDAIFLADRRFEIQEVAPQGLRSGRVDYFFFGPEVLRSVFGNDPMVDCIALMHSAPQDYCAPVRHFLTPWSRWAQMQKRPLPQCFRCALQYLARDLVSVSFYAMLRQVFFGPRFWLHAHLERNLMLARSDSDWAKSYPGGMEAFSAEFGRLQNIALPDWLQRRRLELAKVWLTHGPHPLEEVADAVALSNPEQFEMTYATAYGVPATKAERRRDYERMEVADLSQLARPFWMNGEEAFAKPEKESPIDVPEDIEAMPRSRFLDWTETPSPQAESIQNFWEMKHTGVGTIVPFPAFALAA